MPIELADASFPPVERLLGLPVDTEISAARKTAERLRSTFISDGTRFGIVARYSLGSAYAVRVIAYKLANAVPRVSANYTLMNKRFDDLYYDRRADITVVFKIVEIGADGSLVIIWRQIDRRDAPKLKFAKGEAWGDFRTPSPIQQKTGNAN